MPRKMQLQWVVAIEVAMIVVIAAFFLPGGEDLHKFYIPFAAGDCEAGFTPYHARWFLCPLAWLPARFAWPIWVAISVTLLLLICQRTKVNPAIVMLSFPLLGQVWLGQIDTLVAAGLALMFIADNPWLRGAGILLASIKPHVASLAILTLLLQNRRDLLRTITIPVMAAAISLIAFGPTWPIDWLRHAAANLPPHAWRLAAGDTWQYTWPLLPLPLFFKGCRTRLIVALTVSALAIPTFGAYSHVLILAFCAPWWSLPLSYAWAIAIPFWQESAMRLAWLLPAGILIGIVYKHHEELGWQIRCRPRSGSGRSPDENQ